MRFDRLLLAGTALAAFSAPAFAQSAETPAPTQTAQADTAAADNSEEVILVTGSRIARPNLDSPVPIVAISADQLTNTGSLSIGDTLNDLPQLRSTFSQQNSTRFLGTRGLNLLDLRGLGTARTLVLVNGRRHVAGDVLSNGVSPDINTFPTDLIERVEITTGGASSIYGSDAIAGVVNFI
ncbi:MAG: TonB-dependent receptor plug domain-containing protein, partial [Alphaproteobacteria bacterium]|nr:TonB-dependent receptor plug domain-containing protein [Alphaproteobacteria bacterium]